MHILGLPLLPLILLSLPIATHSQCTLNVPDNPLTANGLSTPYELTGCNQLDFANEGVFVEASIFDPATGRIEIYNPLVINAGMASTSSQAMNATKSSAAGPAGAGFFIPPIMPTIPNDAIVALWFGSNANNVTLKGDTKTCVNGLGKSVFGQFAHCNAPAWFNSTSAAVKKGLVNVPPPGIGLAGQACPTTRDFRIVDQDQSDNVDTTYLLIGNNTLAQHTPENAQANPDAEVLSNASDNALLNEFVQPALNCTAYQSPCTTCAKGQTPALSTNELQASLYPPAGGPALVPLNDPMVLVDGKESLHKVNLYRAGVGQPKADHKNASGTTYCQQFVQSGLFISTNEGTFTGSASPATDQATNLFTFLAMRFSNSFGPAPGLDCTDLLKVSNPVNLTTNKDGVVKAAVIDTQLLQHIIGGNPPVQTTKVTVHPTGSVKMKNASHGCTTPAQSSAPAYVIHDKRTEAMIIGEGPVATKANDIVPFAVPVLPIPSPGRLEPGLPSWPRIDGWTLSTLRKYVGEPARNA